MNEFVFYKNLVRMALAGILKLLSKEYALVATSIKSFIELDTFQILR